MQNECFCKLRGQLQIDENGVSLFLHSQDPGNAVDVTLHDMSTKARVCAHGALEGDKLQVALIDYTLGHTSLGDLREGAEVHVETDVIGKYVQRLAVPYLNR